MFYTYPMMNGYGWGWPVLGFLFSFIPFIIILLFVRFLFFRNGTRRGHYHAGTDKSALDYLKERYAKGEINKEQFDKMKADIK